MAIPEHDLMNGTNGLHIHDTAALPEAARPATELSPETEAFIRQAEAEITALRGHGPIMQALAERELARMKAGEISEHGYVVIHKEVPVRIVKKVHIPSKEYPSVNFVGRLLGPKGMTLKSLQAQTRSRILIFGRGSMWDKTKEEEARNSGDPKFAHLNEELHIYVEITAYPVEAQSRFTHVLSELKKFLDPSHPAHHLVAGGEGTMGPGSVRPPPPGLRAPPPPGYRPRMPMGAPGAPPPRVVYGAPPRPAVAPVSAAQSAYDTSGYYGSSATPESAYSTSAPAADTSNSYGYAAYPAQTDYAAPVALSAYDAQAVQAQQYAAAQQQYAASSQQPAYAAQPAYGQQQVSQPAYAQQQQQSPQYQPPAYAQQPAQTSYGQAAQQPAYGQPAASPYAAQATYGQSTGYTAASAPAPAYGGYPAASAGQQRPQAYQQLSSPAAKKPRLSAPGYPY